MINLTKPQEELEKDLENLSPDSSEYELIRSKIDRIQQNVNNVQTANLTDEIKVLHKNLKNYSDEANRESRQMKYLTYVIGLVTILQLIIAYKQLEYATLQSIPEQISQARSMQQAIEFCKTNPSDIQAPGIYHLDGTGKPALCRDLLK